MIELNTRAVKLSFVPRNPDIWDSVDSWRAVKKFDCAFVSLTSEMQVRAGRDSAERGLRLWYYDVSLSTGDRVRIGGNQWLVVSDPTDSAGGLMCCDVRAAP